MNLHALEIPDDLSQQPSWLEKHLVGLDLAQLAAELTAVHGAPAAEGPTLREVLGNKLQPMLAYGLKVLPAPTLQQLLLHPALLLELQELVLVSGGPYWDRVVKSSADLSDQLACGRRRLEEHLAASGPAEKKGQREQPMVLPLRQTAWHRRPWVASLAAAAMVLVAVFLYQRYAPVAIGPPAATTSAGWGWNKPDALQNAPADAYLNGLADAATEWFNQRPEEPAALAKRIAELRQGCSKLILAEHQPLPAQDRQWLVGKCRDWAGKLDQHLAAVEAGQDPLQVRGQADETVNKLIDALRTRAKGLAAA